MTAGAQQLIPRRDLHEDREISPWRNWHANQRKGQVEDVKMLFVQPEPVVIAARLPTLELHHEFDALRCARRGDAEQILNVDDPESTNLHVMARQLGTGANQNRFGALPYFDGVVGDQPMSAHDQVQRAFALADAALSDNEDAEAENVQKNAVQQLSDNEAFFENRRHFRDRDGGRDQCSQYRKITALGFEDDFAEHTESTRDQNAWHLVVLAHLAHRVGAIVRVEALEIADLTVAEHEHTPFAQVFVEACEREAG